MLARTENIAAIADNWLARFESALRERVAALLRISAVATFAIIAGALGTLKLRTGYSRSNPKLQIKDLNHRGHRGSRGKTQNDEVHPLL